MHYTSMITNLKPGDPVPLPPEPRSEKEIMANWSGDLNKPLVSIVCHTYNHAEFVMDAMNGFLLQKTDFPFEIIVHDDASTDGTDKILSDYQSRYPNIIRLQIQEENQFQKGRRAQSFSFPRAKGKYIAFCEGDDYWIDESKCFKQASCLEANPDVALVYTDSIPFFDNCCIKKDFGGRTSDLTQEELKRGPPIYTLTTCFRNVLDCPIELNWLGYGDIFIWSRLGKVGRGKFMNDILPSFYRVHDGGVHSMKGAEERLIMMLKTYVAMSSYYERIGDTELKNVFLEKSLFLLVKEMGVSAKMLPVMKVITGLAKKARVILGV